MRPYYLRGRVTRGVSGNTTRTDPDEGLVSLTP